MKKILLFILFTSTHCCDWKSQTINYVSNGSFEECVNCLTPPFNLSPKAWTAIDSSSYAFLYCSTKTPIANLPQVGNGFQMPRTGNNVILATLLCNSCPTESSRGYPRGRMKSKLIPGKVYCVTFYVANRNTNPVGIDQIGCFFAGQSIDTINKCSLPLSYLQPQITSPGGNPIIDTLNWVTISGTISAVGEEIYLVLGNFRTNGSTVTQTINPSQISQYYSDVFFDDVSCIELNAPAYAGPDQAFNEGDSLYLGSPRDFAVDELCRWYQLPGNIALDTAAGIWVKPAETSTYVVRQEICGLVKWDTVVVFKNAVGLGEDNGSRKHFSVYPNPTASEFSVRSDQKDGEIDICIYDVLNRIVLQDRLTVKNHETKLKVELHNGIYFVSIKSDEHGVYSKRLIIQR